MKKIILGLFVFSFLLVGLKSLNATSVVDNPIIIKVVYPNGGETLMIGETAKIEWNNYSLDLADDEPVSYNISLLSVCAPRPDAGCIAVYGPSYPIATINSSEETINYDWKVGEVINNNTSIVSPLKGTFKIGVCTNLTDCDYSDKYFTIVSSELTSNTPVISGVSGPQSLKIGQKGEWKVKASAPLGGNLTYGVIWGDEIIILNDSITTSERQTFQQTATFTHIYSKEGKYNPKFMVSSENTIRCITTPCFSNAGSASTSVSVVVRNTTDVCPVGCLCDGDNIACPDPVEKEDKGCLPGYKFSPKTGEVCPTIPFKDGCMPGYKFSPMTGDVCPIIIDDEEDDKQIEEKKTCTEPGSNCGVRNLGISRILKYGVRGDDVKILQSLLNLIQDGVFGPKTQEKLMEWQKEHGLIPDGIFGSQSRQKAETED